MVNIIKFSKYCIAFSILITLLGIAAFVYNGIMYGTPVVMDIDFKGGNIIELNMGKQFDANLLAETVRKAIGTDAIVQALGTNKASVKTAPLTPEQSTAAENAIKAKFGLKDSDILTSRTVQPIIGKDIWQKGLMAMILSSILILIYVAVRFRTMAGISAGTTAVVSLIHDTFIMFTVYSPFRIPINSSFVAAVLTILGYSINDTIIVYDRIRENQGLLRKASPEELANKSILQTLTRSVYTVVTVLVCVVTLYIYATIHGIQSVREFSFPLIIGLVSGCYSSIFIASPLWVWWQNAVNAGKRKPTKVKPA